MNQNPYDSPTAVGETPKPRQSLRPYFIASLVVVVVFCSMVAIFLWRTDASIHGSEILFNIPGESTSNSPLGDRVISYDRLIYTTVIDAFFLCAILLGLSLSTVNGILFFCRR